MSQVWIVGEPDDMKEIRRLQYKETALAFEWVRGRVRALGGDPDQGREEPVLQA